MQVDLRLAFPYVQHGMDVVALQQQLAQGGVVHHRPTAGVDQPGTRAQLCQLRLAQQVPGGVAAATLQRGMQADHITLLDNGFQADVVTAFSGLAQRVAHQHLPAQAAQHTYQPPADLTCTDHAVDPFGQRNAIQFGQGQQAAQHVIDHAAGIAAWRAAPANAGFGKIVQAEVIGTDGAGTDEAYPAAFEQCAVNLGHRAYQQDIGVLDAGGIEASAGVAANFPEALEEGIEQRDVFVGNYQHGALLSGERSVGASPGGLHRVSVGFFANPVKEGAGVFLLLHEFVAEEVAELGNVAAGGRVGGDDLEQAAGGQVAYVLVQHHHRLRAVQAGGIEDGVGGEIGHGGLRK